MEVALAKCTVAASKKNRADENCDTCVIKHIPLVTDPMERRTIYAVLPHTTAANATLSHERVVSLASECCRSTPPLPETAAPSLPSMPCSGCSSKSRDASHSVFRPCA